MSEPNPVNFIGKDVELTLAVKGRLDRSGFSDRLFIRDKGTGQNFVFPASLVTSCKQAVATPRYWPPEHGDVWRWYAAPAGSLHLCGPVPGAFFSSWALYPAFDQGDIHYEDSFAGYRGQDDGESPAQWQLVTKGARRLEREAGK